MFCPIRPIARVGLGLANLGDQRRVQARAVGDPRSSLDRPLPLTIAEQSSRGQSDAPGASTRYQRVLATGRPISGHHRLPARVNLTPMESEVQQ